MGTATPASMAKVDRHVVTRSVRIKRWSAVVVAAIVAYYGVAGFAFASFLIGDKPRWRGTSVGLESVDLVGEPVSFTSADGVSLRAWWIPATVPARGSMVIAHGIDHIRQAMLPRAAFLVRAGYNVLALDLRGHGESGGLVVSPGYLESNDIMAGYRYCTQRAPAVPVGALGVSYGAVAALYAASRSTGLSAVIADGAFPSTAGVYRRVLNHYVRDGSTPWWLRAAAAAANAPGMITAASLAYFVRTGQYLGKDFGSAVSVAPNVRAPVLLISGSDDWIVPTVDARQLQATLTGARTILTVIPGGKHDTTYRTDPARYEAAVLSFLDGSFRAHADSASHGNSKWTP